MNRLRICSLSAMIGVALLCGSAVVSKVAGAGNTSSGACSAGLTKRAVFPVFEGEHGARSIDDLRAQLGASDGRKAWGLRENVSVDADAALGQSVLTVRLPKGSINPKNKRAPLGGMGWRWRSLDTIGPARACLRYRVRFDDMFGFQRGGKLPGLFGGNAPAGGKTTDGSQGFSMRLMWRRAGAGEVYAYIPGHPRRRGQSIQRGAWWFDTGRWMTIAQEVVLNTPGQADGAVRVWVDGRLRLQEGGLIIRTSDSVSLSGVMGDVFYGGKSRSWASPSNTWIRFSEFELRW